MRIGTRGSRLARVQAGWVQARLSAAVPGLTSELVIIRTTGDRIIDRPLSAVGGKGLFVKEIEEALLAGEVDCAVHSLKDLPAELAPGLVLAAVPEREDPRDVLLTRQGAGLADLPRGAQVGTSSLRRAALVRAVRPDLRVMGLRGNVDTRLRKLSEGVIDALLLAWAGLRRLGIVHPHVEPLPADEFVPAIGQGALALESRCDATAELLGAIEDRPSRHAIEAERAFLLAVGGSCVTPLAAHATVAGQALTLRALIAQPDGARVLRGEREGRADDGVRLGTELAHALLEQGGAEILRALEAGA
ncbi:MAG: hydroxymethylbilane synthase [Acidobacteria bacterium RBG_16_68_9]|nr:MAG: hydroxymethylbilane synthase [Acidobacteria bacterium RBG_16_68_9]